MYSGLPYDAIVYEGYLFDVEPITGVGPRSNVLDIQDSSGRLGCGTPSFFITSRCADGGVLCVLDEYVTSATWTRVLDDVSEAEVECSFGGTSDFTCCECLAEAEPWCHELHIWRDGQEVWVGPIQQIEFGTETATVRASDVLGWLSVRVPAGNINYTDSGLGSADLTDIAEDILTIAFEPDSPDFTCELDAIFAVPSGEVSFRFFEGFTETALNMLLDLVETGLNVTTLGRTIVLTGDDTPLVPLILLNDEHIVGEYTVTKDGTSQGNRYYVHFDGDEGIPAIGEANEFYCYGAIERIRSGDGLQDMTSAEAVADAYVEASYIAPRVVDIGSSAQLSHDTPWTINQMVCGARVDVAITRMCLNLTQSFILTGVEVSYSSDGEKVGITLTPVNSLDDV